MAKEKGSKVMVNGALIKQDYTKHANVPDHVIIKDLDMRDMSGMAEYDDTMGGMDAQFMKTRRGVASSRPKSRY